MIRQGLSQHTWIASSRQGQLVSAAITLSDCDTEAKGQTPIPFFECVLHACSDFFEQMNSNAFRDDNHFYMPRVLSAAESNRCDIQFMAMQGRIVFHS